MLIFTVDWKKIELVHPIGRKGTYKRKINHYPGSSIEYLVHRFKKVFTFNKKFGILTQTAKQNKFAGLLCQRKVNDQN